MKFSAVRVMAGVLVLTLVGLLVSLALLPLGIFGGEGISYLTERGQEWIANLPPRHLPFRSGDYQRFPRAGFGFTFQTRLGDRVDSFTGFVTKGRPVDPDTTIYLRLTEAELDAIYKKVIEMRFFDYREPHPPIQTRGTVRFRYPSDEILLMVKAGDHRKTLEWENSYLGGKLGLSDEWKRLNELVKLIRGTVRARPEYQRLPNGAPGVWI